ncbi:MAG: patatin-like phospholipase family protein, partial [Bacteroidales bacterium]
GTFTFESFQKDYYGLLSDDKITQIIPTAVYNPDTGYFELILDITMKEAFSASVGGLISSMNSNEAFFGINYQSLSYYSMDYDLRAYLGNQYNSLELSTRIIFPSKYPFYLKLIGVTSSSKFFEKEKRLFDQNLQAFASKRETFAKLRLGIPFFRNGKIELSTGYGEMIDKYTQPVLSDFSLSTYQTWANSLKAEKNTLNEHMYPDKGSRFTFIGQYIIENESYRKFAGEKRYENMGSDQWFQLSGDYERYNPVGEYFSLGFQLKSVISNKPLYNNYSATIIQAPTFAPTPHSKIALNESFRALSYAAGGIKPICLINKKFHVRTEYYAFVPFINVKQGNNNAAIKIKGIKNINHFGEISLVYNTPIGSISIFGNYYSEPKSNFNYGINIGILLGNSKLIE